ncbi:hypothetical protein H8L32_16910 [Undibacterium sp. CY18W]|uniref:Extracellular repeat, HAF family n=1 Tax=Undibacterium hunanense TaxID=2762292 RepID=A0ABR6ZTI7_9BURK|nr:hypothetical protein [Undibacterium hunanense]MBC3919175.1 hypothetical protein [Undibacterium hunanense]
MKNDHFLAALGSVVLLAASLLLAPHASAAGWNLTDLGAFAGGSSNARGLTPDGRVAGFSLEADGQPYPFLSSGGQIVKVGSGMGATVTVNAQGQSAGAILGADGSMHVGLFVGQTSTDLGSIDGGINVVSRINNNTQVVGYTILANYDERAFVATTNGIVNLGTLGGRFSRAIAINGSGVITGYSTTSPTNNLNRCFVSYGNGLVNIGSLALTGSCLPSAINDAGQIVGTAYNGTASHAFLYDGYQFHDLGTLGGNTSAANGVNQLGQVVGQAQTASGDIRAFLYSAGHMTNLGSPRATGGVSSAYAVNGSGQAIGYYTVPGDSTRRPLLFSNGNVIELNTLLPALTEVDGTFIYLNDAGQIAGTGKINGARHAFLLTPVP